MRPHRALLALASIAAVVAASCLSTAAASPDPSLTDLLTGADETFREEALVRPLRDGRVARCWHTAGINHACFIRFDLGATPRVHALLTPRSPPSDRSRRSLEPRAPS